MINLTNKKPRLHHLSRSTAQLAVLGLAGVFLVWIRLAPTPNSNPQELSLGQADTAPVLTIANQVAAVITTAQSGGWTVELQRRYGYLRAEQGDERPLLALYNSNTPLTPEDLPFLQILAAQQIEQNDVSQAIRLYEQIIQLDPTDSNAYYQLGMLWLIDDPAQARFYFDQIALSNPLRTNAARLLVALEQSDLLQLGLNLTELEAWPAAERVLTHLIGMEPLNWEAYLYRGYVRDQRGANGKDDLEIALGLSDEPALPLYFLGLHWRDVEVNLEASLAAFLLAAEIDPQNPAIAVEVAIGYQEVGRDELAAVWFDQTIRLNPSQVAWHRLRAAFYAERDVDTVDIQPIEQSLALFPDDPHLLTSLGYAHHQLGHYTTARTYLIQAAELDPDSPRTQYYYAVSMERFGDISAAIGAYLFVYDSRLSDPNSYAILAERALQRLRVLS